MEEGQNNPDKPAGLNIEKIRALFPKDVTQGELEDYWNRNYGPKGIWNKSNRSVRTAKKDGEN